jgi:hypothetical protein
MGNVNETFRETLGLEIAKRIARTSIRVQKMSVRILWRGCPPPPSETKEEITSSLRAIDVRVLIILGSFSPINRESRMMVINLDRLAPYEGTGQEKQP